MFLDLIRLVKCSNRASSLKFLALIAEVSVLKIAEIGVFEGENARLLRLLFPEAKLYLIDPWNPTAYYLKKGYPPSKKIVDYERAYQLVLDTFKCDPQVQILRLTSKEAVKKVPKMDLVFIDGSHDFLSVKEDILTWKLKMNPTSILAGHDYWPERFPGVVKAVHKHFGSEITLLPDLVWAHVQKASR